MAVNVKRLRRLASCFGDYSDKKNKILSCTAMMFTNQSWGLKSKSLAETDAPWPNHQAKADVGGGRWLHIANLEQNLGCWPASCHVCTNGLKDRDAEGMNGMKHGCLNVVQAC